MTNFKPEEYSILSKGQRPNYFEKHILPKVNCDVYPGSNGQYVFDTPNFGIIDYYPKADRLLFREGNKWINFGGAWIMKNICNK